MNKKKDKKDQLDRFKDAAREHGCDESEKSFNEKLKKIAKKGKPNGKT